jgi:hypothetical protein
MRIARSRETMVRRAVVLVLATAVAIAGFDAAYAAKKHKRSGSTTHTQQTSPSAGGTQQGSSGPPDPGSYK